MPAQAASARANDTANASSKPPATDAEMIANATSAAPPTIAKDATVIAMDEKMNVRTLRQGTNGWTCAPDMPASPGNDPMCVDKNGGDWMMAYMHHNAPTTGKMGFGYMLQGGSDASNDDPYAEKPAPGQSWITTPPHVMVLNPGTSFEGYPTTAANPTAPYVMFPNTPYAHLMVPVK